MRSKFWVYASLGLVAAASLGVVTTFAYAASGQVALVKSNINITTPDIEITYDGEEHIYGDKKGSYIGELNVGDGIVFAEDKTTCFKAGTYRNRVKYQIINSNGQNVNKDYNIKEDFGIIQIKKRTLNVSVKEEFMSTVPTGKNEISVEKLNITGDGIASNDDVTIYCDKKSYNGTLKFNFSLKSYNSTYNVNTTNCYTVNPEYPYFDENILDYLPPGTQLPDIDEFPPFDPNNMPPGAIQFPTNGGGAISGGPDIESIISKTAIMKVKSDSRGLFLLRGTSYGDYNYLGFNDPTPYSTVGCNYNPNQYFRHYLENQGRRDLQITYLNNFYPQTDFAPYFCTNTDYQSDDINFTFSKDANRTYTVSSYGFIPQTNLDVIDTLSSYVDFSYEEENYQNFVYNTYLKMPDPFYKESLVTYLAEQGISMDLSLKEFDKKLMAMFEKNFKYDYVAFEGSNDTVYEFLTASKIGNCQNFASAATLIYRAKGIPARYTTGYFVYNKQPGKTTVITPLQAHAWVEIYKAGYGWLPLDYTISNLSNIFGEEEELPEIDDPNDTGILGDSTLDVNCNVPETNYLLDVQAKTPGTYYLREESYGDFNLEEFTPGNKYNVTTNTNPNHFVTEALKTYNKSSRTIDVTYKEKYGSRHQLVPTYFAGDSSVTTDCDLYYDAAQTNETKSLESIDFDYLLNSDEVADYVIHDPVLKEEEYYYYVYANKHYLTVPDDIKAVVEEAILKYSPVIPSSPVLICKVARDYFAESYIRFNPRMELSYKELVNDIEGFFENARPEVNAKSVSIIATMLLRSLGVPTRSVKGFLYIAEDDNKYALNDYNEHYWNEVYIKGLGWVTIDFLKSSGKLDNFTDYFTGKTHITIKADNYESYYNGKYQNAPEPYVKEGESILEQAEHFLDYESRGSTDICEEPLDYTITICDYNFNDKTYRYAIDNEFGTMSIKKAPITIYTKSISDTFEPGKVLKTEIERIECPTFGIDDLKFSFNGNQLTNIGSVEAMIDIDTLEIYNISGVEITEKFDINIVAGVLEFK